MNLTKILAIVLSVITLSACGGEKEITQEELITTLKSSGVTINDIKDLKNDEFITKGFKYRFSFSIPEVAPQGGQAFICDEKKYCDPIYEYFDSLKALAGPYLYQSPTGKIVLQLNSGLELETARKLEKAIQSY